MSWSLIRTNAPALTVAAAATALLAGGATPAWAGDADDRRAAPTPARELFAADDDDEAPDDRRERLRERAERAIDRFREWSKKRRGGGDSRPETPREPVEPEGPDAPDASPDGPGAEDEGRGFPSVPRGDYAAKGPFRVVSKQTPDGEHSLFYPRDLGKGGLRHPIITWGNGTGATPRAYAGLLKHWASHGFVVVASNSTMTGSGKEMLAGVDWLLAENERSGSDFHGKLDGRRIGAAGHSQGGGGTINAGGDRRITTTIPIEPAPGKVRALHGPMFVIGGEKDAIVAVDRIVTPLVYRPARVPTVYGIRVGANHFAPVGSAEERMRHYMTAWLRLHLMGDASTRRLFYGDDATIVGDADWIVQRKNIR